MIQEILPYLNFTQLIVVLTFGYFLIYYNGKEIIQRLLLLILCLALFAEVLNLFLLVVNKEIYIGFVYSVSALLFNSLWLLLSIKIFERDYVLKLLASYVVLALVNLFFYEGLKYFNHFTFIIGAMMYVAIFIKESFFHLKGENLTFFHSNSYFLLFCPIVFMLGYSILSSFNNRIINSTIVFHGIALYDIIGYFINFIYYSLLIVFCYRESKIEKKEYK